jgi:murein L,D-transpeptidase YcbB/YkuD
VARSLPRIAVPLVALLALAPLPARADATADALREIVEAGRLEGLRWPRFPDYQEILHRIYEPRGWAPLWLDAARPLPQARDAIAELADARARGLDPRDYDAPALVDQLVHLRDAELVLPSELARFDAMLSVGFLRHVSDLHIGRIHPRRLRFGYDIEAKKYDLVSLVTSGVEDDRIREMIRLAEPNYAQNELLEQQLARYRELAADETLAPLVMRPTLKPGGASDQLPALARWLAALGDLPADALVPETYEGVMVDAVLRFQIRHGLAPDGVIGPATAHALAVPAAARVRQIELALERLRWIPPLASGRAIFVNVPAFELIAYDEIASGAPPALQMAVVVGRAARTETPVFAGALKTVVFAPFWNVPRSIARGEIVPKQEKNPGYLASEGMEIVSDGRVLGTGPDAVAALAAGTAKVRQRPGPKNALGRVKFLFPNSNDVYLHDTPSRGLFQRARRDFSHGCIRVSQPAALAEWVLREQGWDAERVEQALALTRETRTPVETPIPVVIYYATAVAGRDDTISFYADIYGHDAALERALARGYPYPR